VPLLEPRHELKQPREQRNEAIRSPSVLGFSLMVKPSERRRLLEVIPPSPSVERALVVVFLGTGVRDEPITLTQIKDEFLMAALIQATVPIVYLFCVWPVYRACMIWYALTGRGRDLFSIPSAVWLVLKHADGS